LDPSGFAQEQLKKISGLYKDEKNANKFKYLGTEVLKIVEEIINVSLIGKNNSEFFLF